MTYRSSDRAPAAHVGAGRLSAAAGTFVRILFLVFLQWCGWIRRTDPRLIQRLILDYSQSRKSDFPGRSVKCASSADQLRRTNSDRCVVETRNLAQ